MHMKLREQECTDSYLCDKRHPTASRGVHSVDALGRSELNFS